MNRARITRRIAMPAMILLIAGAAVATANRTAHAASSPAAQVRAAERTLLRAVVAHDTYAAGALLAPDFQLIDVTGTPETRTEYLTNIGGQTDFVKNDPDSPIKVRVNGNNAVARVKLHLKVTARGTTTDSG